MIQAGQGRRVSRRGESISHDDAGYVAIDALVALMIFASTLIYSLSATHSSRLAADAALELRKANELAAYLLETAPAEAGRTVGQTGGLGWVRTISEPEDAFGRGATCTQGVVITGQQEGRRYELRTNTVCPAALLS